MTPNPLFREDARLTALQQQVEALPVDKATRADITQAIKAHRHYLPLTAGMYD